METQRHFEQPLIQVCMYEGAYGKGHEEIDNDMCFSKAQAQIWIKNTEEKDPGFNYRIVDTLNRFDPIFIEN